MAPDELHRLPSAHSTRDLEKEIGKSDNTNAENGASKNEEETVSIRSGLDRGRSAPELESPPPLRLALITLSVTLCIFLVALDLTIIGTAIPRITDQFHSLDDVAWYGSAFFLTVAAFQPTWGKIFKYFDLKISYLLSTFLFELGSLICAVAKNSTTLIVGRAVAGVGAAGLAAGGYTIIAFSAPVRLRPLFIGIIGVAFCVSSVIGPLLGGVFTENLSWRWCFYINLPIGGLAAANLLFFFRTPAAAKPKPARLTEKVLQMDLPGTFMIMAATVCLLLALQWGGTTKPWDDADVIGLLVGFILLSCVFIVIEYVSGERALLTGRLMKVRLMAAMCAYIFCAAGVFFVLLYYLPIYFQTTRGDSAQQSGIDNIPLVLAAGISSLVAGGVITATGYFTPVMAFGSCLASIGAGLIYTLDIQSPPKEWIGYQVLLGIGIGSIFQIPATVAQSVVAPEDLSAASAIVLFFQTLGGAIWVSASQAGFTNKLIATLPDFAPGVSPGLVIATGATELRHVFTQDQVAGIVKAYMEGLRSPFAISIACACATFLLAFVPKWQKITVRL